MNRGQLLEEFEKYQQRVARSMTDGGEGKRVPRILAGLSFADFEAGWNAAIEAAGVTVRG
ncbi:hypothetical protein [Stutzerimonas stutzeri]|uniref:Uncharacterized protein n=1 Tax=Stutzerimonas stutzeri TaxID=316 RepID=A0A172WR64_STUST|nr:hypothetical protein [Stutzerimonas stutzeri]ANF25988.1 hypothetical protein PS273GM_12965 [Stutzerimonas stutzeri]